MKVLYFSWLRSRIGQIHDDVDPHALGLKTVEELQQHLAGVHPAFAEAMAMKGVIRCAVNQTYATPETLLENAEEVAFFPPVTGG